jgi:hypothetical protein
VQQSIVERRRPATREKWALKFHIFGLEHREYAWSRFLASPHPRQHTYLFPRGSERDARCAAVEGAQHSFPSPLPPPPPSTLEDEIDVGLDDPFAGGVDASAGEALRRSAFEEGVAAGVTQAFSDGFRFGCAQGWNVGAEVGRARALALVALALLPPAPAVAAPVAAAAAAPGAAAGESLVVPSSSPQQPPPSLPPLDRLARTATQLLALADAYPRDNSNAEVDIVQEAQRVRARAKVLEVGLRSHLGVVLGGGEGGSWGAGGGHQGEGSGAGGTGARSQGEGEGDEAMAGGPAIARAKLGELNF